MGLLMDGLLMAASLFAGGYCWVLSRRVQDLKNLDRGLGGSIVNLTRQIELARTTLEEARGASENTREELTKLVAKAESATGQLRMTLATVRTATPPPAPTVDPAPGAGGEAAETGMARSGREAAPGTRGARSGRRRRRGRGSRACRNPARSPRSTVPFARRAARRPRTPRRTFSRR